MKIFKEIKKEIRERKRYKYIAYLLCVEGINCLEYALDSDYERARLLTALKKYKVRNFEITDVINESCYSIIGNRTFFKYVLYY